MIHLCFYSLLAWFCLVLVGVIVKSGGIVEKVVSVGSSRRFYTFLFTSQVRSVIASVKGTLSELQSLNRYPSDTF
ncbi:hypothetical protein E2C01_048417 [Portunus trituberculatus]|uniref:Uncharacterized protein n=1 Tax=Portunus trituberculatus TaxID=210409 RepID=A0A5B7GBJ5_PORTR|nr:hypothetical protein [Portunus trituberculatus]